MQVVQDVVRRLVGNAASASASRPTPAWAPASALAPVSTPTYTPRAPPRPWYQDAGGRPEVMATIPRAFSEEPVSLEPRAALFTLLAGGEGAGGGDGLGQDDPCSSSQRVSRQSSAV